MENQVLLFYGNDEFLVSSNVKKAVDMACPIEQQASSIEIVNGNVAKIDEASEALAQVIAGYKTIGLFSTAKTIWLQDATFFSNSVIMKNNNIKNQLASIIEDKISGAMGDSNLFISCGSIDRRSTFFKELKKLGVVHEYNLPEKDYELRPEMVKRTHEYMKKNGYSFEVGAVDVFVEKVGFETRRIYNEADKLMLFMNNEKKITKDSVDAIVSPSFEAIIWDFTDAVAERKLTMAVAKCRQLIFQKENPIRLVIALEALFHDLLRFREYADNGLARISSNRVEWSSSEEADSYFSQLEDDPRKMHWFRSAKILRQANMQSAKRLDACRKIILDVHEKMITTINIPGDLMVEILLAKLCGVNNRA